MNVRASLTKRLEFLQILRRNWIDWVAFNRASCTVSEGRIQTFGSELFTTCISQSTWIGEQYLQAMSGKLTAAAALTVGSLFRWSVCAPLCVTWEEKGGSWRNGVTQSALLTIHMEGAGGCDNTAFSLRKRGRFTKPKKNPPFFFSSSSFTSS